MSWAHPENIVWLLFLPLFIGLAIYVSQWKVNARKKFADSSLLKRLFPTDSDSKYWTKVILLSLGILLSVFALMDPLFGEEELKVKREGIDIVYALDLSNSMYAEDVAPNRLERAKKLISESMQNLGGDRVGFLVFAADAYTISPLTTDYAAIDSYIESASPELISHQGTNFLAVLQTAVKMFENSPTAGKLLVIVSDGEDNEKSVQKAIRLAKDNKINVATLAIGTETGAPIPIEQGDYEDFKRDRQGEVVISKLDTKAMQSLAESCNGVYVYLNTNQQALDELHTYLSTLDKEVQDTAFSLEKKHIFQWFLGLALLLIFIDTLTTDHKVFNN